VIHHGSKGRVALDDILAAKGIALDVIGAGLTDAVDGI
jgi:hypothetical protein